MNTFLKLVFDKKIETKKKEFFMSNDYGSKIDLIAANYVITWWNNFKY